MPGSAAVFSGSISATSQRQNLAGMGKYFVVTNPTAGTAIAYALQTAFSATANGLFAIQNTNPGNGPNIYLDYLKLVQTATAPTGTLQMRFEVFNETGLVAMTGNVATRTPVGINTGLAQTTGAVVQSFAAGAATVPAAVGTRRLQSIVALPTGVTVQHDQFVVQFGGQDVVAGKTGLTAARATDPALYVTQAAPIVIAPNTTSWINMWWVTAAANVPSFEFELGYAEI